MDANTAQKNREIVTSLYGLVETLYDEISELPLSDSAKTALVQVMVGDLTKRNGQTVTFTIPPNVKMVFTSPH